MKRLILKFGGTSVGTIEKIKKVANIIKKRHDEGNEFIVIVSAFGLALIHRPSNWRSPSISSTESLWLPLGSPQCLWPRNGSDHRTLRCRLES